MSDTLFAQPDPSAGQPLEEPLPAGDTQRPVPPERACLVCGAENWIWDEASGQYGCGSNEEVHRERLSTSSIWAFGQLPEASC